VILLDTNVVSEFGKPRPDDVAGRWLERNPIETLFLCAPVIMELSFGAEHYHRKTGRTIYLDALKAHMEDRFRDRILEFAHPAPLIAGRLRAEEQARGRILGLPAAMIAAIAIVHGATLATRNVRDFEGLGVRLVNPFEAMR
jgi:predicted nucleic acid-binding protein